MKAAIAIILLVAVASALKDTDVVSSAKIVSELNNEDWKAAVAFDGLTWAQARRMCGTRIPAARPAVRRPIFKTTPTTWDWRSQVPNCVHAIRDQGQCGSCWAFGASEALSDRFCIATQGSTNIVLSPEYLVSCDSSDYGCEGGYLENAWAFMVSTGIPSDACVPYTAGGGVAPACPSKCKDGSAIKLYKASGAAAVTGESAMMNEIYTNGPIEVAFDVYNDFFSYSSGIYTHKSGSLAGGHAVKAIGWGVSSGKKYWIIANSWGTTWGIQGYFWIAKGSDECGIEDNGYAGKPVV